LWHRARYEETEKKGKRKKHATTNVTLLYWIPEEVLDTIRDLFLTDRDKDMYIPVNRHDYFTIWPEPQEEEI
jgi:hypothetical protein